MKELFTMSQKELDRSRIIQKVLNKELTSIQAASLLKISDRQLRNLKNQFKKDGERGLFSKHRNKEGNNRKSNQLKEFVMSFIREKKDWGPTFIKEKLEELYNILISEETIRLWMIKEHVWFAKKSRKKAHRPRLRRECFGELIQADGSDHHWFGKDYPRVNLTVFIDDATGILTSLHFSKEETLDAYFEALDQHLKKYGKPRAFYTDRYSVFQSNNKKNETQMHRALRELDIELILANSPQAKGRVERANRTLQDRLLKELEERKIKTIEEANEYLKNEFVEKFNKKFSKKPMNNFDAHRPLGDCDLNRILRKKEMRTLLSCAVFQYKKQHYIIQEFSSIAGIQGKKIEVRTKENQEMKVYFNGKEVKAERLDSVQETFRKEALIWKTHEIKRHKTPWRRWVNRVA